MKPLWTATRWFCPDCHAMVRKAPWKQYKERFHRFQCEHPLIASQIIVVRAEPAQTVITTELATALLERVRHDHGYPMDFGPHQRCDGCVLEEHLQEALALNTVDAP